jgi:hypothetical protein
VCFEVIEHVEDTEGVLDELARVLAKDGVLAISSPNRGVYMPGNPHHRHEFVPEELEETLAKRFSEVRLYRQADWVTSAVLDDNLHAAESKEPLPDLVLRKSAGGKLGGELYTLALGSSGSVPDPQGSIVLSSAAEIAALSEGWEGLDRQRREVARRTIQAEAAADEAHRETAEVGKQLIRVESELARARQAVARAAAETEEAESRVGDLESRVRDLDTMRADLEFANRTIREMQASRVWRLASAFWRVRDRILGRRSS